MNARNAIFWIMLSLHAILCMGTNPSVHSYCYNARKPTNGDVRCSRCDLDEFLSYGGKSSRSGSKSKESGSRSSGHDVYSCRYSCNKGYMLDGPSILECPFDVSDNPTCVPIQCKTLPWIDHGALNCSNGFLYRSKCQYTCAPGFNISGGSDTLTCGSDGLWNNAVPKCQPVLCPPLLAPIHGSLSCPNGRSFGADCRFSCDDRYRLIGWPVLSCLQSGYWTGRTPKCVLGECRPLPFLIHGSITCTNGWDSGSRCSYSCHSGYRLKGGNSVLTCASNGYWKGYIPTCQKGFYTGKPDDYVEYNYFAYDYNNEPAGFQAAPAPGFSDGGSSESGLSTAAIISLLALAVLLIFVAAGLFVAYRRKKNSIPHQRLSPGDGEIATYQSTE